MILSRVKIDPNSKNGRNLLSGTSEDGKVHGCVESCFSGERRRRLWRIDKVGNGYYLMLLSEDMPNLSPLETQYGFKGKKGESIDYDKLLNRVENGTTWNFRIVANPSKRESGGGKIRAHVSPNYAEEWFLKKAEENGFDVKDLFVGEPDGHYFKKRDGNSVHIVKTVFTGTLTVTDSEKIRNALINGIGRGKAYGAGMLTLVGGRKA